MEIFAAGDHRGKSYTRADLNSMVRNFERFSTGPGAVLRVPVVLGHEEDQDFLERSDLPAAAWPDRVYREGDTLYADFDKVAPVVRRLLKNKAYRTVSSEVYDEPPEGIPGVGKTLRRIAFLGGDIPQIKTLDQIADLTEHSEGPAGRFARYTPCTFQFRSIQARPAAGSYVVFSEVRPMNRDELLQKLAEMGCDAEALKDAPDQALAEMARVLDDKGGRDKPADGFAEGDPPEPKDDCEKKSYAERARKMGERAKMLCEKYGDPLDPDPTDLDPEGKPVPKKVTTTHQYSEARIDALVTAAVVKALGGKGKETIDELQKFREEVRSNDKRQAVESFCEAEAKAFKLTPAELDRGSPVNVYDRLMRADASQPVAKFRERGKDVVLTELDLQMREIKARQPHRFGERVKTGPAGAPAPGPDEDGECAKVREHYEAFREDFKGTGATAESLVKGYQAARKHDPRLTAEEFLP